ncbi:MAG: hypothetical protein EKK55_25075 [Rhodocyclaceae bacterium]|nr:MAG: hypothetical protein EKK55_25075 [Rhodocyclaceae bacterium]
MLFSGLNARFFQKMSAHLGWTDGTGSGFTFTLDDIRRMSVDDMMHYSKFATTQRQRADAARRAATKARPAR